MTTTGDTPVLRERTRVLLVDDQELFRRGLLLVLSGEPDLEVDASADGPTAIAAVAATAPDVVLLDVRMPGMSGLQTCAEIKAISPSTSIVMLTSSDEETDLYESIKNGASGYLLKDSSIDQVAEAIRLVATGQSLISPSMAAKLLEEFKAMSKPDRLTGPGTRLSERELEVLRHVALGKSNGEIASTLFISENTVKNHVRNILQKLQTNSRMEAVMYAVRTKLLDLP